MFSLPEHIDPNEPIVGNALYDRRDMNTSDRASKVTHHPPSAIGSWPFTSTQTGKFSPTKGPRRKKLSHIAQEMPKY